MIPAAVIRAKRDGEELSSAQLEEFVRGFLAGDVTPYQMSAFLMAVYLRGMSAEETGALTRVMVETGETLDLGAVPGIKIDKHSTGGVGDLVSIPLAPLVASCGVPVPMISGRGLGHTGGTLDKLESIPGFRTDLDRDSFLDILGRVGCVMGGQTESIAPADRRMYALRDVTSTVESIPLIVSSILCKKIAEGIDGLVLDVKCGRGAFMKTEEAALALARELTRVGDLMGKRVVAFVTDMDAPLGTAVGAAPEMRVALECLRGRGPEDLMTLVTTLGAAMLCLGEKAGSWNEAEASLRAALDDGRGLERFRDLVGAQGGDPRVIEDPDLLPGAPASFDLPAPSAGTVVDVDPLALGQAVVELGGGRLRTGDEIDPGVGILLGKRRGDRVEAGESLARIGAGEEGVAREVGEARVLPAFRIETVPAEPRRLVRWIVTARAEREWRGGETWSEVAR